MQKVVGSSPIIRFFFFFFFFFASPLFRDKLRRRT